MVLKRIKAPKNRVRLCPGAGLRVDDDGEFGERRKEPIMNPAAAQQLPDALDGIVLRAVGGQETQREILPLQLPPSWVECGVVILGIVDNDDDPATGASTDAAQVLQEVPAALGVEATGGRQGAKVAVLQAHGAKVADAFADCGMHADQVLDLWRQPRTAVTSMLLKMDFVHRPQIDAWVTGQLLEFFLCGLHRQVGLGDLRPRLAQPKAQLAEQPLTLLHGQRHTQLLLEEGRQQRTVRQLRRQAVVGWAAAQCRFRSRSTLGAQVGRLILARLAAQPPKNVLFEAMHPILRGSRCIAERLRGLATIHPLCHEQHSVQPMNV